MPNLTRRRFTQLAALALPQIFVPTRVRAQTDVGRLGGGAHEFTLLYTNDFHSAFGPIPAYWRTGSQLLGGAAHLATLIERERAAAGTAFLLDSGDMFTGTMSFLTQGEALMEMMTVMRYDALGVGNHEFDYGWQSFDRAMTRVPFPVLCCNIVHRGSGVRFTRPYTILERGGVRLGVIGVMGLRAARNTIMPSKVAELEFTDPVASAAACVRELRGTVDTIVVLGHQGLPGPMQTDAENEPSIQRPLDEDLAFCAAVPGVDVYVAAHSHHGLEVPLRHPDTGTLLVQTYGYGTRLGRIRLKVKDRRVVAHDGELLEVRSDALPPHAGVADRIAHYRRAVADKIGPVLGRAARRIVRKYKAESPLGSFIADVIRARMKTDVALTNAGGLRADLPAGDLDRSHLVDAFPFTDNAVTVDLTGRDLKAVLEHGLSLQAGMIQVAGLRATYDLARPTGERLISLRIGAQPVTDDRVYRVGTINFLAEGGDGYAAFKRGRVIATDAPMSDLLVEHVRAAGTIDVPTAGRIVPA